MDFVVILLNLIGLILYLAAGGCVVVMMVGFSDISSKDKTGVKIALLALLAGAVLVFGGYWIREGAEKLKRGDAFTTSLKKGDAHNVVWQFRSLSNSKKEKYIADIFEKFYNDSISSQIKFIEDFGDEKISFVKQKNQNLNSRIKLMYDNAERMNTDTAWLNFSKEIPGGFFLNRVDANLKDREFRKWKTDEESWKRVLLMDSAVMAREYLKKYPNGTHVVDAKRIILNHTYDSYSNNKSYFRVTNYDGTTTLSVHNSSDCEINVHYSGTFADGNIKVQPHGSSSVSVPNGYYHVSVHTYARRAKSDYWSESFNGGVVSRDYRLVREY